MLGMRRNIKMYIIRHIFLEYGYFTSLRQFISNIWLNTFFILVQLSSKGIAILHLRLLVEKCSIILIILSYYYIY